MTRRLILLLALLVAPLPAWAVTVEETCTMNGSGTRKLANSLSIAPDVQHTGRMLVRLSDRPPSRLRLSFDRSDGEPGHRQLVWDPFEDASLSRAISLPKGTWEVSVDAEPFPFGTAGSQPLDYGWRLCRDKGAVAAYLHALAPNAVVGSNTITTPGESSTIHLVSVRGIDTFGKVTDPELHTIRLDMVPRPSLATGLRSLTSAAGGSAATAPLARRSMGVDAAAIATQLVEVAGEVMIERAQVEGLEAVREELQRFTCEELVFEPRGDGVPPELAALMQRLRPRSVADDQPVFANTCTALGTLRIDQLAASGDLILRSMVQDGIQLSGLLLVDQSLRASGDNPFVRLLEGPVLAVVDLGVAAVRPEGVTDADAQRVLVRLAGAVAGPFEDPAAFALSVVPMVLRGVLGEPPTDAELESLLHARGATAWSVDERAVLLGWLGRVGLELLAETTLGGAPRHTPRQEALLVEVGKLTLPIGGGDDLVRAASALATASVAKNPADVAASLSSLAATGHPALDTLAGRLQLLPSLVKPLQALEAASTSQDENAIGAAIDTIAAVVAGPNRSGQLQALRGVQCAAGVALAVAAECQAQSGCDARAISDLLTHPEQTFATGMCKLDEVRDIYARWGRSEYFVATSLDILSPPRNATPRSQAVAVTGLVFDLLELVVVSDTEFRAGPAPLWTSQLAAGTAAGRRIVMEAMNGDTKTALTTLLAYVGDQLPSWFGNAKGTTLNEARAAALMAVAMPALEEVLQAPGKATDPAATAKLLGDSYTQACDLLGVDAPKACARGADRKALVAGAAAVNSSANLHAYARQMATVLSPLAEKVLATHAGEGSTRLLSRVIAFGVFASDFAGASQITDDKSRKEGQKQAVRALSRSTTDRTRRRSDWVWSVGGTVGTAAGLRAGEATDIESFAPAPALGGLPIHLNMGFAMDQVPTGRSRLGWHFDATAIELGRMVDWGSDEAAIITVASPSDMLRFGTTAGFTFGRPNVPLLLGVHGWIDPAFATDQMQQKPSGGGYLVFGFYVPLLDFN
ncbi:MAG: hypothetical protein Q8P18_01725 [Pseudomonadota bacterium]|nr:hypothetical protein [Pseudomonadota bacterium]